MADFVRDVNNPSTQPSNDQINKLAMQLLHEEIFAREKSSSRPGEGNEQKPFSPKPEFPGNTLTLDDRFSFIKVHGGLVIPALGSLQIGTSLANTCLGKANTMLGTGMLMGAAFVQMPKDFHSLTRSTNLHDSLRSSACIAGDAGILAGGAMTLGRVGPKWLGPAVVIGSAGVRIITDMVPNSPKR